jgi:LysR family transcriptional regulator, carnitine catabolism transcriptional activator
MNLSTRQLRAFLMLADERHFTHAAQRPNMPGLQCEFLCDDPYFVVCRKDHPLADRQHLTLADLGNWPII